MADFRATIPAVAFPARRPSPGPLLASLLAVLALAWPWAWPGASALAAQAAQAAPLSVTCPAFKDNDRMPRSVACEGGERSPALAIDSPPAGTVSLAVLMTEMDPPRAGAALWMVYNLPPGAASLPENQPRTRALKNDALQLPGASGKMGYSGPCQNPGAVKRYAIEVFALDTMLDLPENADKRALLLAAEGHILARAMLVGRYKK